MTSVASGGATERITARTFSRVLRAGSGTPARYSSTFFGAAVLFVPEPGSREILFFMRRKTRPQPSPQYEAQSYVRSDLLRRHRLRNLVDAGPRGCSLQRVVHVADVLHAFVFQPCTEGGCALLGEDGDAVFPGGASAEHAVELDACFGSELQVLDELRIANARRQIDKRLAGCARRSAVVIERFLLRVGLRPFE